MFHLLESDPENISDIAQLEMIGAKVNTHFDKCISSVLLCLSKEKPALI